MKDMTPRDRWFALFNGQKPDRLPTDYWATPEFHAKLKKALGIETDDQLWGRLGIDRPLTIGGQWKYPHHPDDPLADPWGIRCTSISYGTGSYDEPTHNPLANATSAADIHAYRWPSPTDIDITDIPRIIDANNGYRLVVAGHYEPFMLYCAMRGREQAYEDLIADPEIVEAALGYIFEFSYELHRRIWQLGAGRVDMLFLAEDLGGQTGPLFSLDTYRKFFLPGQRKMAELARTFGLRVFYHTDGASRIFLPDLVNEVGIDILNPLQWRCSGMELMGLARDYGDRLIFHGGIDNQRTLPFGTAEDVRREVRECAAILGDCRWICAPCHYIQNVSPVENIVALYETAHAVDRSKSSKQISGLEEYDTSIASSEIL